MSLLVFVGFLFYEPEVIKFKIALHEFLQLHPSSLWTCYEQNPEILFPLERALKVSLSSCSKETVWWNQPHRLIFFSLPPPSSFCLNPAPGWAQYCTSSEGQDPPLLAMSKHGRAGRRLCLHCPWLHHLRHPHPAAPPQAAPFWSPDPEALNLCPPPNSLFLQPTSLILQPPSCTPHPASPRGVVERASSSRQEGRRQVLLASLLDTTMESFIQGAKRLNFGPGLASGGGNVSNSGEKSSGPQTRGRKASVLRGEPCLGFCSLWLCYCSLLQVHQGEKLQDKTEHQSH